ncbi:HipA domain protein [Geotalea daltonii FRC-32]|uniref:HipA domain protein n=1 Tax=Geotalea daltonii (strain DSM 22248 / JCM 15807 / FRC-32) TaxID=316067 RepID=B9M9D9_GEODF|nr:HipA domain-containing protein [Geotalea daltonii]ACM18697.1 HipA domain protein [Geotalea daltonii FRC-32]
MTETLLTYLDGIYLGKIILDGPFEAYGLEYDETWIGGGGFPISPHLQFHKSPDDSVRRFLSNLLPEGRWLEELSSSSHISKSNTFGLIAAIGSETTGALTFRIGGEGSETNTTNFRPIETQELEERIRERNDRPISLWDGKQRLSTAGVQDKLPVMIMPDGTFGFGEGDLASTHILKFDTKQNIHLVLNEFICMTLAHLAGLPAANVKFVRMGEPVLVVERFDRKWSGDESIKRLHLIDGCQMLDLLPTYKYERPFGKTGHAAGLRTGASLQMLFDSAKSCRVPALTMRDMLNWTLFQLLIGNSDAHAKNISFFLGKEGIDLAPAYDLVCLDVCGDQYDRNIAMAIGDVFDPDDIQAWQLAEMCFECKLPQRQTARMLDSLCNNILRSLTKISLPELLTPIEEEFARNLIQVITNKVHRYQEYAKQLPGLKI